MNEGPANLILKDLHILHTNNNIVSATITPNHNIKVTIKPIIHRATTSNSLERRISITITGASKKDTITIAINKISLESASGAIIRETRRISKQQAHVQGIAFSARGGDGLLHECCLCVCGAAGGEIEGGVVGAAAALDGEGYVAEAIEGPGCEVAAGKVAVC